MPAVRRAAPAGLDEPADMCVPARWLPCGSCGNCMLGAALCTSGHAAPCTTLRPLENTANGPKIARCPATPQARAAVVSKPGSSWCAFGGCRGSFSAVVWLPR